MSTPVQDAEWVAVYSADPRGGNDNASRLAAQRDREGWRLMDNTAPAQVYAFWRSAPPVMTLDAVDTEETYAVGERVYDAATGHVYEAVAADAPGNDLSDESWTVVTVPVEFRAAILKKARALWLEAEEAPEAAERMSAKADDAMQDEFARARGYAGDQAPWLNLNSNL